MTFFLPTAFDGARARMLQHKQPARRHTRGHRPNVAAIRERWVEPNTWAVTTMEIEVHTAPTFDAITEATVYNADWDPDSAW